MLYCDKCHVSLTGHPKCCPLCQGDLIGEGEEQEVFPTIEPLSYVHRTLIRFILFVTIIIAAVSVALNLSFPIGGYWFVFVLLGVVSFWLTGAFIIIKRNNIPKNILWQVAIISGLAVAWDCFTGFSGWSVDFVLPILCICAMVAMSVVGRILKIRIEDYIVYLLLNSLLGVIPLILLLCGIIQVVFPTAICIASSVISVSALLLFEGRVFRDEIIRRLHL